MSNIKFYIDNKECIAKEDQTITRAAKDNGIFIPTLCDFKGLMPAGTCRICTCKVNGNFVAACTTKVEEGMKVENNSPELENIRKAIIELLYVEGNHQCAACEKSGSCELQAMAYRHKIMVPRFPYLFPVRQVESPCKNLLIDTNRCIQCMRCVRGITTPSGKHIFKIVKKDNAPNIIVLQGMEDSVTEKLAEYAVKICPVGAILGHGEGFTVPIGKRKYDNKEIGEV